MKIESIEPLRGPRTHLQGPVRHEHEALSFWDRWGILLSAICLLHCLVLPFVLLSLPMVARYYFAHPWAHMALMIGIVPVGLIAFYRGYKHHRQVRVVALGTLGLLLIGLASLFFHNKSSGWTEALFVSLGSLLLIWAHWQNQRSCRCS